MMELPISFQATSLSFAFTDQMRLAGFHHRDECRASIVPCAKLPLLPDVKRLSPSQSVEAAMGRALGVPRRRLLHSVETGGIFFPGGRISVWIGFLRNCEEKRRTLSSL